MSTPASTSTSAGTGGAPFADRPAAPASGRARLVATLLLVLGTLFVLGGAGTWAVTAAGLSSEGVTVAESAPAFVGASLDTPWEAWAQTEAIRSDVLAATDGRTYAEIDREDPLRDMATTGTFLRASLLTSVVAFGVATALVGIGVGFLLGGLGLRSVAGRAA
ncbi:aromatic ring-opening dioxygenase LigA [Cellulomonas shaoxiangyii]|uniref:Aromatic ring-opening dioxygenase LigA n=1 Tax=Cellulomonas shaoxiangyii TaxID=2566013 RepID=A0A4P7SH45_9CELL|nr:aromatic ring-opening dioxygenase LigA [Cellulomonas shaoxiangyii]QCB93011.1 aromatic ring-opening dioxygenase LigA [Cellulomonas shaoxiangyii]TGY85573.1 aromatic ring-opening dioxygenase LigA [Cellulomonas shaoxiangyii]